MEAKQATGRALLAIYAGRQDRRLGWLAVAVRGRRLVAVVEE
jgi:hypothetical protein